MVKIKEKIAQYKEYRKLKQAELLALGDLVDMYEQQEHFSKRITRVFATEPVEISPTDRGTEKFPCRVSFAGVSNPDNCLYFKLDKPCSVLECGQYPANTLYFYYKDKVDVAQKKYNCLHAEVMAARAKLLGRVK